MKDRCPFCESPKVSGRWLCGTVAADEFGEEYRTGTECDKTVYRNAFLSCLQSLELLVAEVESDDCPGGVAMALDLARRVIRRHAGDYKPIEKEENDG